MHKDEAQLAKGVVESYQAGADSRAAYWAVELDLKLGIGEDHKPGDIAARFIEVVNEALGA